MKIEGDEVTFSTGRTVYANNGIIGLGPDGRLYEGYDGHFSDSLELTDDERTELCKYMAEAWLLAARTPPRDERDDDGQH